MSDEVTNELVELRKALAELQAEYQSFAYIISHDLSAVLRQTSGFTEIIYNKHAETFDDRTKRHFELILKGSETGKELLDGLLRFSRLNTVEAPNESVNCNDVFTICMEQLSHRVHGVDAEITCNNLPSVYANEARIAQVFYNLLENTLIYVRYQVNPKIFVSVVEKGSHYQFSIADNGIGIREKHQSKIFDVLQRVDGKKYDGIGMGLAIARKIIQQHGGSIWVESELKKGSTFYFTIPK